MSTNFKHNAAAKPRRLTAKQQCFIEEYLIDLNATQAAIRAGFSPKTAYSQGQRLLKNVEIKAAIDKAFRQRSERTRVDADKVIRELARIGFLDIRNLVEIRGNSIELKSGVDMTDDDAAAIAEVSDTQFGIKIKAHNKLTALQLLARHTGIIKDNKADGLESESEENDLIRALDKTTAEAFADESGTE